MPDPFGEPCDPPLKPASELPPADLFLFPLCDPRLFASADLETFSHTQTHFDHPDPFLSIDAPRCGSVTELLRSVVAPVLLTLPCSFRVAPLDPLEGDYKEVLVNFWFPRHNPAQVALRVYEQPFDGAVPGLKLAMFRRSGPMEETYHFWRAFRELVVPKLGHAELGTDWPTSPSVPDECDFCECDFCSKQAVLSVKDLQPPLELHMRQLESYRAHDCEAGSCALLEYSCPDRPNKPPCSVSAGILQVLPRLCKIVKCTDPFNMHSDAMPNSVAFTNVTRALIDATVGAFVLEPTLVTDQVADSFDKVLPRAFWCMRQFASNPERARILAISVNKLLTVPQFRKKYGDQVRTLLTTMCGSPFLKHELEPLLF